MQRLEVSGALRHLQGSLGVKGLTQHAQLQIRYNLRRFLKKRTLVTRGYDVMFCVHR